MRRSSLPFLMSLLVLPARVLAAEPAPVTSSPVVAPATTSAEPSAAPSEVAPAEPSPAAPGVAAAEPSAAPPEAVAAEPSAAPQEPVSKDSAPETSAASQPSAAVEAPPPPRLRLSYTQTLVVRANPLGLEDRLSFMLHRRLINRGGRLFSDNHIGFGLTPSFSPSIVRLGGTLQFVPLALLQLKASYYFIGYFGSDKFKAHPFNSPSANAGPNVIDERSDAGLGLTTWGGQAELSALLQMKFGPIALRNDLTFFHYNVRLPEGNDVFYDRRHDIIAPARGWVANNDSDLLYINQKIRLTVGVRGTYVHAFYPDSVYEPDDSRDDRDDRLNALARVGPLIAYTFKDRPHRRFMRPTLYLLAQWWVKHRFRTGQDVSQAIPMVVVGFSFTGDLWVRQ